MPENKLAVERRGDGRLIVLAHGLTATRRYVVHGSRLLERSGFDVISYDARGHGESDPAPRPDAYEYADLVGDLAWVMDSAGLERAILAGASMGAATCASFALAYPERVEALVQITPAYVGSPPSDEQVLERWDELASALERDGVDGFMSVYGEPPIAERFRGLVGEAIRQRLARHRHPQAVADAIRVVVRSAAFDGADALQALGMPVLVIGSRDELDPEHPLAVAERYAELIPGAELAVEETGKSPLAWRGAQLSRAIAGFVRRRVDSC